MPAKTISSVVIIHTIMTAAAEAGLHFFPFGGANPRGEATVISVLSEL